ncbi:hypothetical protein [Hamadaea tsunoensis]|uniref:hypothetical protein n=1 Tax=Hamadaea tsunoensis TaxID=53368 RepID=UPI0012FC7879|nr:hypothetical protein [Hamadaea tsunoensis]
MMVRIAAAVLGLMTIGACTAPPAVRPPASDAATRTVCFASQPPPQWTGPATRLPDGVSVGVHAVGGEVAFGQSQDATGRGVAALDLLSGRLSTITRYKPEVSGLGALAVEEPWVVWEQLDSKTNLADWSVHAVNRKTGESVRVADSHGPGGFLPGQQPLPVLRHGLVAWAQPVRTTGTALHAELRVLDLARHSTRVLDSGRLSSPVYAGGLLVWAKVDDATRYSLRAVDESTLEPVELPEAIQRPSSVAYLGGSADRLVWSSGDALSLEQWDFTAAKLTRYTSADRSHPFQFLQVAGDYLLWDGGTTASVLDLTTGAAFDTPGTVAGSARWIVNARPGSVVRVPVAGLPHLSCPG